MLVLFIRLFVVSSKHFEPLIFLFVLEIQKLAALSVGTEFEICRVIVGELEKKSETTQLN